MPDRAWKFFRPRQHYRSRRRIINKHKIMGHVQLTNPPGLLPCDSPFEDGREQLVGDIRAVEVWKREMTTLTLPALSASISMASSSFRRRPFILVAARG